MVSILLLTYFIVLYLYFNFFWLLSTLHSPAPVTASDAYFKINEFNLVHRIVSLSGAGKQLASKVLIETLMNINFLLLPIHLLHLLLIIKIILLRKAPLMCLLLINVLFLSIYNN